MDIDKKKNMTRGKNLKKEKNKDGERETEETNDRF